MFDVIAIGSATQDVFLSVNDAHVIRDDKFTTGQGVCFPFGSKLPVQKISFASGGGGTNAAVTFARQGLATSCIGVVGEDHNGTAVLEDLRRNGVDAKYFQVHHGDATAYSVVLVSADGERTILSYKGEGIHLDINQIPWNRLDAKWCYIDSLGGRMDVLEKCVQWAQDHGVHIATNPGAQELEQGLDRLAPLWRHMDVVGMNQEEAALLTNISYERADDIFRKLDEVIGGICIMTKGRQGVLVSDGRLVYSSGIPKNEALERTGAGDAFHSGFLAEFIRSGSIEKAIQLGTANASSVTMHYGAKEGILLAGDNGPWPLVEVTKRKLA